MVNRLPQPTVGRPGAVSSRSQVTGDGRCQWGGVALDVDLALDSLFSRRRRTPAAPSVARRRRAGVHTAETGE